VFGVLSTAGPPDLHEPFGLKVTDYPQHAKHVLARQEARIMAKIGIQLYTVRDLTDDETFKDTVTTLARMGFQGVEFAWKYGGMAPDELAAFLASLDLECCGLHVQLDELLDPGHQVYEYALACRSPFITTSLCSRVDEWADLIPQVEQAGRIAGAKGLCFTYHNHWQEFARVDGVYAQDLLRDGTSAEHVRFELDLGWICKGGEEPMAYWRTFAGRTPQIHLRDYDVAKQQVCDVGDGFIDVAAVKAQAAELGAEWLIYEQDRYPASPLESCRVCMDRLAE
jgi:sugar phosphate isomerase/epimerase